MENQEILYGGINLRGLVERFTRDINYFLREAEILEGMESSLSELISKSVAELNPEYQRGNVWLCRFNAQKGGQDAFYLEFNPTSQEKEKVRFIQAPIAEGRFLTKKIRFFKDRCYQLPYVEKEFIPFLKTFFKRFGFEVLEGDVSFSKRNKDGG